MAVGRGIASGAGAVTRPRFALARFTLAGFVLARFAVSCPTSVWRFEERSPRFAAGVVVAAVVGMAGGEVDRKRKDSEAVFVVTTDVGSEGVISGAGTGLEAVSDAADK